MGIKLIHTSDWHLGAGHANPPWPPDLAARRRKERERAIIEVIEQAAQRGADYLVVAGDVCDGQELAGAKKAVVQALNSLKECVCHASTWGRVVPGARVPPRPRSSNASTDGSSRAPVFGKEDLMATWHDFEPGRVYFKEEVLIVLRNALDRSERIGQPFAANDLAFKKRCFEKIGDLPAERLVFMPVGSGWGNSPMNSNCWQPAANSAIMQSG